MKCSFCNANIPDGEKTCPACGAAVSLDDVIPSPSPYYTETVGEPIAAPRKRAKAAKAEPAAEPPAPETVPPAAPEAPEPAAPAAWEPPVQLKSLTDDKANWAIASLVLGVLGLASCVMPGCCTLLSSVPAIILGFMSMKSSRKGFAIGGVALGFLGILIMIVWILFMVFAMAAGENYN